MIKIFKKQIVSVLIVSMILSLCGCISPYSKKDIIYEYEDFNCLYYEKCEYKKYKYSDYIFDDISNGMYKKSTPNIADYKLGSGLLDYDIPAYVQARMDYAIKVDLINKYETRVDSICAAVHDEYFEYKNSYIHFYDKKTKKDVQLNNTPATNIAYDNEVPNISFDIDDGEKKDSDLEGRRIMLSDIIAANTTIDGFMRVLFGENKKRLNYFMERRIDNDELFTKATISNIEK